MLRQSKLCSAHLSINLAMSFIKQTYTQPCVFPNKFVSLYWNMGKCRFECRKVIFPFLSWKKYSITEIWSIKVRNGIENWWFWSVKMFTWHESKQPQMQFCFLSVSICSDWMKLQAGKSPVVWGMRGEKIHFPLGFSHIKAGFNQESPGPLQPILWLINPMMTNL